MEEKLYAWVNVHSKIKRKCISVAITFISTVHLLDLSPSSSSCLTVSTVIHFKYCNLHFASGSVNKTSNGKRATKGTKHVMLTLLSIYAPVMYLEFDLSFSQCCWAPCSTVTPQNTCRNQYFIYISVGSLWARLVRMLNRSKMTFSTCTDTQTETSDWQTQVCYYLHSLTYE